MTANSVDKVGVWRDRLLGYVTNRPQFDRGDLLFFACVAVELLTMVLCWLIVLH